MQDAKALRCRIRYSPESIQWVVTGTAFCTFVRNRNDNLNVPYLYDDGGQVVVNWNWLDNDWNGNNPAARFATLFISLLAFLRESFVYSELVEGFL